MKRREIIDYAKQMVLNSGPSNVLEFGDEYFDSRVLRDDPRYAHRDAILREARIQAHRVYEFLGYRAWSGKKGQGR